MATGGGGEATVSSSLPPKGYPTAILDEVNTKFQCAICNEILRNAVQSYCGHRFCRECFEYTVRSSPNNEVTCLQCISEEGVNEFSVFKLDQIFPDNAIKRETANVPTRCSFPGCDWTGSFKDYEVHYVDCEWFPMTCILCGSIIPRNQFEQHNCSDVGPRSKDLCPYGCGQKVEGDIAEHIIGEIAQHVDVVYQRLRRLEMTIGNSATFPEGGSLVGRIEQLERSLSDLERSVAGKEREPSSSEGAVGGLSFSSATIESAIVATSEKMIVYDNIITVLNREVEKLSLRVDESQRRKHSERDVLDTMDRKVKSLERTLAMKDATIAELDLRITSLEQTSYSGTLLWRIPEFQRKRQDAVNGRTTSIYSAAFYTSRTGYKMCARIYLNGDGMGKGTHVSLFFVIMRGAYDALLKWPFRQKVTLMFLDQSSREHVVDAFRPDPTSSSFKRPTTEMNIASGCPLLMSLTQLDSVTHAYVKDNVAFIKIVVGTDDL